MKPFKKDRAHTLQVFLNTITRTLPQYIFWKDRRSIYLGCNQNYAELVGLHAPEEIIGKTDRELRWQSDQQAIEQFMRGDCDTMEGHPITNQEETLVLQSGKKLIALVSKLPILDENKKVLGVVGYFSDITELKQKECELMQAKLEAEAANHAKSVFITNITHDIRTPLTGLLGMAQIIAQELKSVCGRSAATDLIKAGNSLLELLNEVIEFSKCESGELPLYDVKFELKTLIDRVIRLVIPSAREKRLSLETHLSPSIPPFFIGDSMRLQRILLNLLNNAIKFTPQGTVRLMARVAEQKHPQCVLELKVEDTGIGIAKDKQAFIFTRFSRLHPAYQGKYAGLGLGLALVKRFISELNGEIYVDSEEHQGTTVTCLIPLQVALLANAEHVKYFTQSIDQEVNDMSDKSILIVEDNPIVQRVVQHQLSSLQATIEIAENGKQALQKATAGDFDLIIMDIGLPDQNGYEVTLAIHAWQKKHKKRLSTIVALSAHLDEADQKRCLEAGMVKVFIKPLDEVKIQALRELLANSLN